MTNLKLIVNKIEIELAKNSKFAFSKQNQIWQFDRILLERSQSIKIPKTKKNMEIFGFSDRADFSGIEMRQTYDASLWYSGGNITGDLHIVDFSEGYFNCIFVFGKNRIFKRIHESGKIKDFLYFDEHFAWDSMTYIVNGVQNPELLQLYQYEIENRANFEARGEKWNYMPSTSLYRILQAVEEKLDIQVSIPSAFIGFVQRIGIKLNGMKKFVGQFEPNKILFSNGIPSNFNNFYFTQGGEISSVFPDFYDSNFADKINEDAKPYYIQAIDSGEVSYILIQDYKNNDDGIFDKGIFIFRNNILIHKITTNNFTPISKTIHILEGDKIVFATRKKVNNILIAEKYDAENDFISCEEIVHGVEEKITYPDIYYLQPNLPKITTIDILKTISSLTSTAIYVENKTDKIKFFDYNFDDENFIELEGRVLSEHKTKRSILDYAQNNYIKFASSENIEESSKLILNLSINNENLIKEKDIYTIPFSDGNKGNYDFISENNRLKISDIEVKIDNDGNKTYEFGKDKDTLFLRSPKIDGKINQVYFEYSQLPYIFQNSTSIELTIQQRLFEFMQIDELSVFLYKNKRWSWSDARWDNNRTRLSLIRLHDTFTI